MELESSSEYLKTLFKTPKDEKILLNVILNKKQLHLKQSLKIGEHKMRLRLGSVFINNDGKYYIRYSLVKLL